MKRERRHGRARGSLESKWAANTEDETHRLQVAEHRLQITEGCDDSNRDSLSYDRQNVLRRARPYNQHHSTELPEAEGRGNDNASV